MRVSHTIRVIVLRAECTPKYGSCPSWRITSYTFSRDNIFMKCCGRYSYVRDRVFKIFMRELFLPFREFSDNGLQKPSQLPVLYLKHGPHPNRVISPRGLSREEFFMRIYGRDSYVRDLYLRFFIRGLLPPLREFPRNECERQCATLMLCFTALPQRRHRSASAARRTRLAPSTSRHGLALARSG